MCARGSAVSEKPTTGVCADGRPSGCMLQVPPSSFSSAPLPGPLARGEGAQPGQGPRGGRSAA